MNRRSFGFFILIFLFSLSFVEAKDASKENLQTICALPLAKGKMARVVLYKNQERELGFYELIPDLSLTPHGPHTFFDDQARQVLVQPNRPVTPDDPIAAQMRRKRENLIKDYRDAEAIFCEEVRNEKK